MSKIVYLKLDTHKGIITLPFKGLEEVDYFTVMYENMGKLTTSLIKLLKLPLDSYDVSDVYLSYDKYNSGRDVECLPIKYGVDNFNFESLKMAFVNYLKNDPNRIFSTSIRYSNIDILLKYFDTGVLDNYALEDTVRRYFADGTGYKRRRDTYFLIKGNMDEEKEDNVLITIDPVKLRVSDEIDKGDLSIYSTGGDDHLNHLVELCRRYPELREQVMDEIGQSDSDDVRRYLNNDEYAIVDGVSNQSSLMRVERAVLEEATGLSIDNLRTNHTNFGRRSSTGRNRRSR